MSDEQILYISSMICFIAILTSFKYGKLFAVINLLLFCTYSIVLYYNLFFNSGGGSSLLWLFYLSLFTLLQIVIVSTYIGIKLFHARKRPGK